MRRKLSKNSAPLRGESLIPRWPSCRDVLFFGSLFDKGREIILRLDQFLVGVVFSPRRLGDLVMETASGPDERLSDSGGTRGGRWPFRSDCGFFFTLEQDTASTFTLEISSRASVWPRWHRRPSSKYISHALKSQLSCRTRSHVAATGPKKTPATRQCHDLPLGKWIKSYSLQQLHMTFTLNLEDFVLELVSLILKMNANRLNGSFDHKHSIVDILRTSLS